MNYKKPDENPTSCKFSLNFNDLRKKQWTLFPRGFLNHKFPSGPKRSFNEDTVLEGTHLELGTHRIERLLILRHYSFKRMLDEMMYSCSEIEFVWSMNHFRPRIRFEVVVELHREIFMPVGKWLSWPYFYVERKLFHFILKQKFQK